MSQKSITLQNYLFAHNIRLSFMERDDPSLPKYYTHTNTPIEVISGRILVCVYGNGKNKLYALKDFAKQLSSKEILIGGYGGDKFFTPRIVCNSVKGF